MTAASHRWAADVVADLASTRALIDAGAPVFVVPPGGAEFRLPTGWQRTLPDPAVLEAWQPGWAVCLVTGHVVDVVDVDVKNGADVDEQRDRLRACGVPVVGEVCTPSGGAHFYVPAAGLPKGANRKAGVDFQGRNAFVFMPPTLRPKYRGAGYSWGDGRIDVDLLADLDRGDARDALLTYLHGVGIGPGEAHASAPVVAGEPVDVAGVPPSLRDLLADLGPFADRSSRFHHLVAECRRTGLSQGQTVALLEPWCAAVGKFAGRVAAEVARSWPRVEPLWVEAAEHEPLPVLTDELAADRLLAEEVAALQRRRRARVIVDELEAVRDPRPAPDVATLDDLLARPEQPLWRVEGLLPARGRLLLSAQRKTGKTTFTGGLARCLITGEPFLGRLPVQPVAGRVVVLNYEVSGPTLARWYHQQGVPGDRCVIVNLRGTRNLLADERGRAELVDLLCAHDAEVLVVDPFGRAFTGKSQNDAAEVAPWLVQLDQVAEAAGVHEVVLTAHAGWDGERTRGSSALEDWPDAIAWMTRDPETDARFLRAEGRDVDLEEDALYYDAATRALTLSGAGSRRQVRSDSHLEQLAARVVQVVTAAPGLTTTALEAALRDRGEKLQKGDGNKAARLAADRGWISRDRGDRGAWRHFLSTGAPTYPDVPQGQDSRSPRSPIGTGDLEGGAAVASSPGLHSCAGASCRMPGCHEAAS